MYNHKFDEIDEITMDLRDQTGTGYRMAYKPRLGALAIDIFNAGDIIATRKMSPSSVEEAREYDYMLTTPRSVGDAILEDEKVEHVSSNFMDGWAVLDRGGVQMDFELTDPTSNECVTCFLGLTDGDVTDYYATTSFVMRSTDLLDAARPMEALLY